MTTARRPPAHRSERPLKATGTPKTTPRPRRATRRPEGTGKPPQRAPGGAESHNAKRPGGPSP